MRKTGISKSRYWSESERLATNSPGSGMPVDIFPLHSDDGVPCPQRPRRKKSIRNRRRRALFLFCDSPARSSSGQLLCSSPFPDSSWRFWGLISAFGLISLWEFYGMLDQRGLPNFKLTAMICGVAMLCGSFYYFSHFGLANSYEFETAVLLLFLLTVITRQMFARLREDEPLQAMAYTLFGLLDVLWLFNFMTKILYVVPRSDTGAIMGQFYCLYLIAITKFSDMGAYLTGSVIGRHPLIPHISPKKTWEGFAGAMAIFAPGESGVFQPDARTSLRVELDARHHFRTAAWFLGGDRRSGRIDHQAQHRGEGFRKIVTGIGGALDLVDSLLFTAPLLFFYLRLVVRVP